MSREYDENDSCDPKNEYDFDKNDLVKVLDGGVKYPPLVTPETEAVLKSFYENNPKIANKTDYNKASQLFDPNEAWIQTYTGVRFTPTNPNPDAIVIQDIAHALSNQCRFSGHVKQFYSVAQHCVLVSYICNFEDAMTGLLHDATEAYLVDVPRPLKRSGKFDSYLEFEEKMRLAICNRFNLPLIEPSSVKKADELLLYTEARDLMSPLRKDWHQNASPLPFKIEPLNPTDAKHLFLNRFYELNK